jgi:hypothetical protein
LLKRLVAAGDVEGARALAAYSGLNIPSGVYANDNEPDELEQVDLAIDIVSDDGGGDARTVMDTDSNDRTRPTVAEIMRAAPSGRREPVKVTRHGVNGEPIEAADYDLEEGETLIATCGALVFDVTPGRTRNPDHGFLVEYGRTSKGRPRRPSYRKTGPKGAAWPERTAAAISRYVGLPSSTPRPGGWRRPLSDAPAIPPMYCPLPRSKADKRFGVEEGRGLLVQLGVDGAVDFEDARIAASRTAERYPDAICSDEFDGVVHGRDDAPSHGDVYVPDDPREALSARAIAVLEIVLAGGTLADIGRYDGAPESTAGRRGIVVFDGVMVDLKAAMCLRPTNDNVSAAVAA